MRKLLAIAFASILSSSLLLGAQNVYPDANGWNYVKPEKHGFSSRKFKEIEKFVIKETHGTGMMVIVGGEVIYEYGYTDFVTYIASCRKSVLSMMYGKYVESGQIDMEKTIGELGIDDVGGLLPIEKTAKVKDLLAARSGVYHAASNTGSDNGKGPERGSVKPGTYFLYNNWDFNTVGTIFEQCTGKNIYDAFNDDIAIPTQMQDWDRARQHKRDDMAENSIHRAYHFDLSTRDMARIGYLMLRKGNWNGQQLVPEKWVDEITSTVTPLNQMNPEKRRAERFAYGYMWWIFSKDSPMYLPQYKGAYTAHGLWGQYITVVPELDMVVAFKTDDAYKRKTTHKKFFELLDMIVTAK